MAKYYSYTEALNAMRRLCSSREKCHQDIRTNLIKKNIYGLDLDNIIATLIEENYLNEERYARSFARGKFRNNNWGRNKIIQGLKQKNISEYCIQKGLDELDQEAYIEKITQLIHKKSKAYKVENAFKLKGKIVQYLIGKGYEQSLSWTYTNKIIDELGHLGSDLESGEYL